MARVTGPSSVDEGQTFELAVEIDDDQASGHSIQWDLGDGTRLADLRGVSHAFAADGSYTVVVAVRDPKGATGNDTHSIVVRNVPPRVSGCADVSTREGDVVRVAGVVSDPGNDVARVSWDFGDGTVVAGAEARHVYETAGTYTLALEALDDDGARGSCEATARVRAFGFKLGESDMNDVFDAVAPTLQRCFHFTGSYGGVISHEGAAVERQYAWVEGTYRLTGAFTGNTYRERVRLSFEYRDDDSIWMRAMVGDSTTMVPPDAKCPLRGWTRVGDVESEVVGHVAQRGYQAAETTWDLARLVGEALSDDEKR